MPTFYVIWPGTSALLDQPGHTLLLHFNRFGELWADVGFFMFAFGLMTWFLFFKLPKSRRTDQANGEESPVLRRSDEIADEPGDE